MGQESSLCLPMNKNQEKTEYLLLFYEKKTLDFSLKI